MDARHGRAIPPSDIDLSGSYPLLQTFGHRPTELTACSIVRVAQKNGDWTPFSQDDLQQVHQRAGHGALRLERLLNQDLVQRCGDRLEVTDEFIDMCADQLQPV